MKKKVISTILSLCLVGSLLCGCGDKAADNVQPSDTSQGNVSEESSAGTNEGADAAGGNEESEEWEGEISHIVLTWLTGASDNVYMDQIVEQVNEISRKKAGVEIEVRQVTVFDAPSAYTRWIGGQEQIDLMLVAFTGISPYIQMSMIEPLDELIVEYGPHITALYEEGKPIYDTDPTEGIHGLMALPVNYGIGGALQVYTDVLEETELPYKDGDRLTLEQVDEVVRAVYALHPETTVGGIVGSAPRGTWGAVVDTLGTSIASGALVGVNSTTVVNYFESEEYQAYLKLVRGWYEDGIVIKDAATIDVTLAPSIVDGTGRCLLNLNDAKPDLTENYELTVNGRDISCLFMTEKYLPSPSSTENGYWTIPVTSGDPVAAMRFLDLMYSDKDIVNLLTMGIKDLNYFFTDEENGAIQGNAENSMWAMSLYGNNELLYLATQNYQELKAQNDAWNEEALSNTTKGYGFCYDSSAMISQITAIDAVLNEYRGALECGSVDLDTVYPEFIKKLKANGIDEVIADKQAQFDAWLAEQ